MDEIFLCLRCRVGMKFLKEQSIEEKDFFSGISNLGEFFAESVNCKWYVCPRCRMVELRLAE